MSKLVHLVAAIFVLVFSFGISNPAHAQVPRDAYTNGPVHIVIAQSREGPSVLFRVSFRGHINHSEHYGSGRCSWKHDAKVTGSLKLIRGAFPTEENLSLWHSEQGSNYRGRDGTCGDNRSQIDGNWRHARTAMDAAARGGITLYRERIENFLKGKQPNFTRFIWRLPPSNFDWVNGNIESLDTL